MYRDTKCHLILESKARRQNVHIFLNCHKNIHIYGSPTLFSHIMTNLISNAIDAYEKQKPNKLNTKGYKIIIYCTRKKKQLEIKVKDFGTGISPEIQSHIFETFFTTKSKHGCGIGLSATKHTVEKYFKGTISFISDVQQGTTFIIKIPIIKNVPIPIPKEISSLKDET